jgi:type II secretion system protein N
VRRALLVLLVFAAGLALTFPTDTIVRALLARVIPSGAPALVFGGAALRPWGLRLDEVALRRPDGSAIVTADWITFRPSLRGLWRDGTGRPWTLAAGACGGTVDAVVGVEDTPAGEPEAQLAWRDVALENCPPLAVTAGALTGLADGTATVQLVPGTPAIGELRIRAAKWRLGGRVPSLDALHADPALLAWRFADGWLVLDRIDLHGPELEASGTGTLVIASAFGTSNLEAELAVLPGPSAPPLVRDLLKSLPPAQSKPGARLLALTGTVGAPRLVY